METQASFDTWTTLFLVVSAIGTFLSVLLFTDPNGRKRNWPIAGIILGFSLILISYVFYWTGYMNQYRFMGFYPPAFYLAFGPLLYYYISSFYRQGFHFNYWHFAPAVVVFLLSVSGTLLVTFGVIPLEEVNRNLLFGVLSGMQSPWAASMSFLVYLWFIQDLRSASSEDTPSQASELRDTWTRFLSRLFGVFALAYISYYILVMFPFFNAAWDYAISIAMSMGIYSIGYMAYTEPKIFNGELFSQIFHKKTKTQAALQEHTKDEFYTQLISYIETHKPYRNNDLRLVDLADEFGFSSHLLSQIINEKAQTNFNRFINDFRLRDAETHLANNPSESIKVIYFDAGFNSKATFYSAFRKKHGCTPSEYANRQGKA